MTGTSPVLDSCRHCADSEAGVVFKQLQGKSVAPAGSPSHTSWSPNRVLVQPVFEGSKLLLQALVLEAEERMEGHGETLGREAAFFEVTIASVDQPKLLSRLSEALVRAGQSGWEPSLDGCTAQD